MMNRLGRQLHHGHLTCALLLVLAHGMPLWVANGRSLHDWKRVPETDSRGISGTTGFIVGTELVLGALDVTGFNDLIVRTGIKK